MLVEHCELSAQPAVERERRFSRVRPYIRLHYQKSGTGNSKITWNVCGITQLIWCCTEQQKLYARDIVFSYKTFLLKFSHFKKSIPTISIFQPAKIFNKIEQNVQEDIL